MHALVPLALSAFLLTVVIISRRLRTKHNSNYPPGPPKLPFIGNVLDLDSKAPWKTYQRWGEQYGPLFSFSIFDRPVFVVNSFSICRDLFDKRSHVYSDRPELEMLNKMGWDYNLAFMRYHDKRRRKYRQLLHHGIGGPSLPAARATIVKNCDQLLLNLFREPADFLTHVTDYASSVILEHTFGFKDQRKNKTFIYDTVLPAIEGLSESAFFGAQALFAFPFLAHLPSWFPGVNFLKVAQEQSILISKIRQRPLDHIKRQKDMPHSAPSWALNLLEESTHSAGDSLMETDIMDVTATALTGGFHTTASALQTVLLAITMNPDVQAQAQEEIDRVVGHHRLPDFSDYGRLPYVTAICKEALRWHPPIPLAPHAVSETDHYMDYEIPKDITMVANIWAVTRDTSLFKDPDNFCPERFLTKDSSFDQELLESFVWGFGRRSCPGRLFAESVLWMAVARILAVYSISKYKTPSGLEVNVEENYVNRGLFIRPMPFQCSIAPRSEEALELISSLSD
ncbi:hypothetical protein VKT23_005997 [Stygiomarasmius scandens]|uniref:Cytochrome P450 n=1 Tax=Marasmiellus scandens TaxID=2682957 RepID=A0ABR1JTN2_9AGAR